MSLPWPGYGLLYLGRRRLAIALNFGVFALFAVVIFAFMEWRYAIALLITAAVTAYAVAFIMPILIVGKGRHLPTTILPKKWEYAAFAVLAISSSYWVTGYFEAHNPYRVISVGKGMTGSSLLQEGDLLVVERFADKELDTALPTDMLIAYWDHDGAFRTDSSVIRLGIVEENGAVLPQDDETEPSAYEEHFYMTKRSMTGEPDRIEEASMEQAFTYLESANSVEGASTHFLVNRNGAIGEALYVGFSFSKPTRIGKGFNSYTRQPE